MKLLFLFIFMISNIFAEENAIEQLSPYILKVSDGNFNNKVDLIWDSVLGTEYYTIERVYDSSKNTKSGKNISLDTNVLVLQQNQTRYTDNTIPSGQYLYIVTAYQTNIMEKNETYRERKNREKEMKKTGITIAIPLITNIHTLSVMEDTGYKKVTDQKNIIDPLPFYTLKVSNGDFNNKVELIWNPVLGTEYYTIERVYDTPQNTKLGKKVPLETNVLVLQQKQTRYTDNTIPFGQYLYTVKAHKTNIARKNETSRERKSREKLMKKTGLIIPIPFMTNINTLSEMKDTGYRTVTDKEFFLEFQKTIDTSLPRIRTMKMLNFFGEKKKGWQKGQLVYKTTGIFRKPFRVMIEYKDFVDQSLSLNGLYEIQIFKLFAQEGKLVGTFMVDGIYKGTITHNLIIDRGQSVGGTYDVQQEGKTLVSLPWDITTHPLDDTKYEEALQGTIKDAETKSNK